MTGTPAFVRTKGSTAPRVLVTGASGFVGHQVIAPLLRAGWAVHAVGRDVAQSDSRWYRCDLLDAAARRRLVAEVRPDAVLHCAWVATPGHYAAAPENLDWAAATLGLVREALAVGTRRLLLVGSCAEYDWANPPARPWREDDPVRPTTLYGIAKHSTQQMAAALVRQAGATLCWARLFHLLGPRERAGRLVPDLMRALRDGTAFATGPGEHVRDWLDVRDAGRALAALLDLGADGIVNVGSGQGCRVASLVATAVEIAGSARAQEPAQVVTEREGGGPAAIVADTGRLRRLTGFKPAIPLEQSLRDAWAALQQPARAVPATPPHLCPSKAPQDVALPQDYEAAARLFRRGRLAEAERAARVILAERPKDVAAINLLGVSLRRLGRGREAQELLREATRLAPADAMPLVNLGNVLLDDNAAEPAVAAFRAADELAPLSPASRCVLGRALAQSHRYAEALDELARALAEAADIPAEAREILAERARTRFAAGDAAGALAELDQVDAGADDPADNLRADRRSDGGLPGSGLTVLRAQILRLSGDGPAAQELLHRRVDAAPEDPDLHAALADALLAVEDRPGANQAYRRALALRPGDEAVAAKLCWSLLNSRYRSEAEHLAAASELARSLIARSRLLPGSAHAVQSVLLRLADLDALDEFDALFPVRQELLDWWVRRGTVGALHAELSRVRTLAERQTLVECHRAWGERTERAITPIRPSGRPQVLAKGRPQGRVRVGFMSSDLRNHPVSYFAEPIFRHYDRERFAVFAYSFNPGAPDAVQRDIASRVEAFNVMPGLPDEAIAGRIAQDGLDILLELGGSTHLNRLHVLAHQPAPVQVSWLGYPHSSGLSRIGHILVDPFLCPQDPALLIEQPMMMPASWVTLGPLGFNDQAVIEDGLPEDRAGLLTFGTMNNPYKYTREGVALWAEVLRQVPSSRFMIVRPEAGVPAFRENVARAFARHAIDASRLVFRAVRGKHLLHYNEIDIALDTVPQTGGTTTCESLWMGVPTVTLAGAAFFERLSFSNLSNSGLADLAASDGPGYVACALRLAGDAPRRRSLRRTLRNQIQQSPLGNNVAWVRDFESQIEALIAI